MSSWILGRLIIGGTIMGTSRFFCLKGENNGGGHSHFLTTNEFVSLTGKGQALVGVSPGAAHAFPSAGGSSHGNLGPRKTCSSLVRHCLPGSRALCRPRHRGAESDSSVGAQQPVRCPLEIALGLEGQCCPLVAHLFTAPDHKEWTAPLPHVRGSGMTSWNYTQLMTLHLFLFFLFQQHPWHVEVPRPEMEA